MRQGKEEPQYLNFKSARDYLHKLNLKNYTN